MVKSYLHLSDAVTIARAVDQISREIRLCIKNEGNKFQQFNRMKSTVLFNNFQKIFC